MKTFKDLKIGDIFYYYNGNQFKKHKIVGIRKDHYFIRYIVPWLSGCFSELVVPIYCSNESFVKEFGVYTNIEDVLNAINKEFYEDYIMDTE